MIEECRATYMELANKIPDWKSINRNDLCRLYITHKDEPIADSYLSAIICRYWYLIEKNYNRSKDLISKEVAYDWLIDTIRYVLENHVWDVEGHSMYGNPNGPDICINRKMSSNRDTYYQLANRNVRKLNFGLTSLDSLSEDYDDAFLPKYEEDVDIVYSGVPQVKKLFDDEDFNGAFILDGLINADVFVNGEYSQKKLLSHLKQFNDSYCEAFASTYNVPLDKVKQELYNISKYSYAKLNKLIKYWYDRFHTVGFY